MPGHETARTAVRDWLAKQVPIRLLVLRDALELDSPDDPRVYLLADALPDDDTQFPAVVVGSTRTLDMTRRGLADDGDTQVYDVDYEVTVAVAVTRGEFVADEKASIDRDRLLQAVREALMERMEIAPGVILISLPVEATGPATQSALGRPLAAGTSTVTVRSTEALIPTRTLANLVAGTVNVTAVDAAETL